MGSNWLKLCYANIDKGERKTDADGNELVFTLTKTEIQRLLAVTVFWDNLAARTPGGTPSVLEWYTFTDDTLSKTLRNATAGRNRSVPIVPPPPPPPPPSHAATFEKGTRRSVSDYKVFRDRKTWNQFQRGLLATAHMHGVGDIIDVNSTIPIAPADQRKLPLQCLHNCSC